MSHVQLLLRVYILQGLVIREENELMQVMSPITKFLNHRAKFLIVGGVSLSGIIQLLTELSNWMTFLSDPDASHTTSKTLKKSGRCMTEAPTILFLISINASVTA